MPSASGKSRRTLAATTQQLFRIIQSIPSKKAEPFKLWLAEIANQRLDQLQDPELSIEQAMLDYKRLGYSDNWINQRLKSIEIRKELTDEWKKHGLQEGAEFAFLTDVIYKTWAGKTAKEYKQHKGLKKENLRDNMTNRVGDEYVGRTIHQGNFRGRATSIAARTRRCGQTRRRCGERDAAETGSRNGQTGC